MSRARWWAVGFAGLLAGCGGTEDPAAAYREIVAHAERNDWGAFYDRLDQRTRDQHAEIAAIAVANGMSALADPRDAYIALWAEERADSERSVEAMRGAIIAQQIEGDRATLTLASATGETRPVRLVWERGEWRLDLHFDLFQSLADRKGTDRLSERTSMRLRNTLRPIRSTIHTYRYWNDEPPNIAGSWEWLSSFSSAPVNPLSPPDVASRVAVVTTPGAGWDAVDPTEAGWIWNSADLAFYAAGFDDWADRRAQWNLLTVEQKQHDLAMLLQGGRNRVRDYRRAHGTDPDLVSRQWTQYEVKLPPPPGNPQSPRAVSRRVAEVTESGVGGAAIDPSDAGWVWNSADGTLHLAGYDEP
ncbi:MAG: hypothetical protein ACYS0D_01130 [Planctomycetota bacterium]|jgi:hypothetical protein